MRPAGAARWFTDFAERPGRLGGPERSRGNVRDPEWPAWIHSTRHFPPFRFLFRCQALPRECPRAGEGALPPRVLALVKTGSRSSGDRNPAAPPDELAEIGH